MFGSAFAGVQFEGDIWLVNLPTLPPAETWVQPPDEVGLMRVSAILGQAARVIHPVEGEFDLSGYNNLTDAVMGIITATRWVRRKVIGTDHSSW